MFSVLCEQGSITNNCTIISWTCNNNNLCIAAPCLAWSIFTTAYHNTWLISRPFLCSRSILPLKRVSYAKMETHHGLIPSLVACKSCTYAFVCVVWADSPCCVPRVVCRACPWRLWVHSHTNTWLNPIAAFSLQDICLQILPTTLQCTRENIVSTVYRCCNKVNKVSNKNSEAVRHVTFGSPRCSL